ncbi:uncharacterized protein LOC129299148 [Prosopis cineraria]|uniref:uncharacterized protein LOC129299148 n=1 Tax=Prosopis cineraria TaxID=364024 RepID=UPI0024104736|nr:uncharacterized protein LOC129299148 [Prosopis cineraria]
MMGKANVRPGSKSERKFEKKLEFYSKVRSAVSSLSAQKSITKKNRNQRRREKKLKAYDLSALCDSLPELKARGQPAYKGNLKLNCKSRQKILVKEQARFLQNLNDPSFQTDPLSAIHQHLLSTQPVVEEQPKKKENKNGSMKRKEKKLKALVRSQNMEMSF